VAAPSEMCLHLSRVEQRKCSLVGQSSNVILLASDDDRAADDSRARVVPVVVRTSKYSRQKSIVT